jgi:hypothetical protein
VAIEVIPAGFENVRNEFAFGEEPEILIPFVEYAIALPPLGVLYG